MTAPDYPPEFLELLHSIKAKRARTVIDHILAHGQITTAELKDLYGYNHPPRAIRDVREQGIPIITERITGPDGRKIAAYKFGDPAAVRPDLASGRTAFSTKLKNDLIAQYGSRCHIYLEPFPAQELQIDHRIPFEISGEPSQTEPDTAQYMLLCASANRAKSWSCEHCPNWQTKTVAVCQSCYWAYPEAYTHVAMRDMRRLDLLWVGEEEAAEYELLVQAAQEAGQPLPDFVKAVLRQHLRQ